MGDVSGPVADERPARYVESFVNDDGQVIERVVYRASSLGGCTRAVVAAARKFKPKPHPQWFVDVLDEGTRMESVIAEKFVELTGVANLSWPDGEQWEVELEVGMIDGRLVVIRGHMDDISEWYPETADHEAESRVREYKKFRPSTWDAFVRNGVNVNGYYPWQVSVYMHATGLPCDFVGGKYNPETDTIDGTFNYLYRTAPITLLEIKRKVAKVERLVNEGYAPDEVECSGNYPCGFWHLHDPKKEAVELPGDDEELNAIVAEWQGAHAFQKSHEHQAEQFATAKADAALRLNAYIEASGNPSTGGTFILNGLRMTRTKSSVPEATITRKAYTKDYWTMKAKAKGKGTDQ